MGEKRENADAWLQETFGRTAADFDREQKFRGTRGPNQIDRAKASSESAYQEIGINRDQAYKVLQRINSEFRGNTYDIPLDEYDDFAQAAEIYLAWVETQKRAFGDEAKIDSDPMVAVAKQIIKEAPQKEVA